MRRYHAPTLSAFALVLLAAAAEAECFVDYKAKRDDPLRLHYGVMRLPDAACADPAPAVGRRLAGDGWQLLTIMGTFDASGAEQRRGDAGEYYLRY